MNTNTNTNTNIPELTRANKLTVKVDTDAGCFVADFFKTHKHVATIRSTETGFVAEEGATATANREAFRKFIADHAADIGVLYDPTDRRAETNVRKAVYQTEEDVAEDAIAMITPDIQTFINKMPNSEKIVDHTISIDALIPKTKTSKGSDLVLMGIDDGRYANGNLAWFDIDAMVTMTTGSEEIYQPIKLELVSGQLKKFRMTQTQWNSEVVRSMVEAGVIEDPAIAKTAESKTAEPVDAPTEEQKEQASEPKSKRTRKSKKAEEIVEG